MTVIEIGKNTSRGNQESALKDALESVGKDGALRNGTKILIIALDSSDDGYDITWFQAGMKMSECVALCEIAKTKFLSEIGYMLEE